MKSFKKLKAKLAELFQLDQAELDFGIYRIMNARREEITRFLNEELLPQVRSAFDEYRADDKKEIQEKLNEAIRQAEELGVDPNSSPKVKELRAKLEDSVDITALENEVYDHLYNFFSRYYDEGDFISLRRYKEGVYAIPYEGEEVKLYWANHDQYYIKTTEYFRDYLFRLPDGRRVHFKIVEADTEKDNIKATNGKDRRFFLHEEKPVAEEGGELVIRFEYRPDPEKRKQSDIDARTIQRIMEELKSAGLSTWHKQLSARAPTEKNPNRTVLEKHLNDYTKRNTFDYFIHKDLRGFLRRELDFYIKNEVMHLDDIENESASKVEQYLSKIKVIRRIAHKIIDFLAQIEDFQKKLWLKKKFVVETNYCLTLDRVPEELYPEIAANDAQRREWVKLFAIDEITKDLAGGVDYTEPLTVEFLKANPHLVVDTRHFDEDFKRRLIEAIEDIDEQCDGLLVHSENFQALNLLLERYRGQVKCVYIDPPYNTEGNAILYKNSYRHSSWLSLMEHRLRISKMYEDRESGVHIIAIDGTEQSRLSLLLNEIWANKNIMCISVIHNPGGTMGKNFSDTGEYAVFIYDDSRSVIAKEDRADSPDVRDLMNTAKGSAGNYLRSTGKTCFYPILVRDLQIIGFGDVCPDDFHPTQNVQRADGIVEVYPIDNDGVERKWVLSRTTVEKHWHELSAKLDPQTNRIRIIRRKTAINYKTVWTDSKYSAKKYGTEVLGHIIPETRNLPRLYPKSIHLVRDCVHAGLGSYNRVFILDYFAGSGTTAHAVIELNREDGGKRKYILVEMGDYFDTVLMPRIKKVVYSKDWKDGKPLSRNTGISHMFKYIRLESYEDTLTNIELKRTEQQELALAESPTFRESYMLRYMLETEAKGSPSLLNIDWFDDPFSYTLLVGTGSVGETKPVKVDLVETFNWLLGLRVQHMNFFEDTKKKNPKFVVVEGTSPKGEKVLIIWRKIRDLTETDPEKIRAQREEANRELEEFFKKQQYNTLDSEFDIIYVNGDNNLMNIPLTPETEGAEPRYKVRLIEEEFKRLMFDVKDV